MVVQHACKLETQSTKYRLHPIVHLSKLKRCLDLVERPTVQLQVAKGSRLRLRCAAAPLRQLRAERGGRQVRCGEDARHCESTGPPGLAASEDCTWYVGASRVPIQARKMRATSRAGRSSTSTTGTTVDVTDSRSWRKRPPPISNLPCQR
ncbi:TPA: hypothetical protein N0F65_011371 [Lagenidium giganteum]|uniref:Uncharacterized protein n=1 Tax=Lagenidium giganteum TaxID=4803 RepID=A0AAV2Z789_9STRA|nr:TPA: hypothetical protein N0F65_011371 [Lagenidium giganteum]